MLNSLMRFQILQQFESSDLENDTVKAKNAEITN